MSKADDYRRNAELCRVAAAAARDPQHRAAWLKMASDWLGMIPTEAAHPDEGRATAESGASSPLTRGVARQR